MNSAEFNQRLLEVVKAIREAEDEYRHRIEQAAAKERRYKRIEAKAFLHIEDAKNVAERQARAETLEFDGGFNLGDVRYEAHLASGLMDAAKLALRSHTQELSALQSEASLAKAEAEFVRTGPHEGP